ncbi:MAG: hypothetical protein MUF72_20975 [Elainella sp. Prado103]|nr:hypothetical protein [Elainella sp. Prado103]
MDHCMDRYIDRYVDQYIDRRGSAWIGGVDRYRLVWIGTSIGMLISTSITA